MLHLILSVVMASANFQNSVTLLKPIAVIRNSFKPLLNIFSRHAAVKNGNLLVTDMNMTTSTPTVRLDNFPDAIEEISCSTAEINVKFFDQQVCNQAFMNWQNVTNLAFLLGRQHGCNDDLEGTVIVSNMRIGTDRSIVAVYEKKERDEVVDEWDALIFEEPIKRQLSGGRTLNLDFNLNSYFQSVGQFMNFENCRSNGSVTFRMELRGNRKTLLSYMLSMNGDLTVNADLKIGVKSSAQTQIYNTNVLTIPFLPISIPGILLIGPSFLIDFSVAGFSDTEVSAEFGFDYHMPIEFQIASKDLQSAPKYNTKDTAKFTPHPLKYNFVKQPPTFVGGLVNTVPKLVFDISIMDEHVGSIRGSFGNELGIVHRFKNATNCPDLPYSTEIFHRHSITAALQIWLIRKSWSLWDTGRKLLSSTCEADVGKLSSLGDGDFQSTAQTLFQVMLSDLNY